MAIAPCRECRKPVSTEAKTCPNCGVSAPVRNTKGLGILKILGGIFALILVFNLFSGPGSSGSSAEGAPAASAPNENNPDFGRFVIAKAKTFMQSQLKDPESVRWGRIDARVLERDGQAAVVACGSYNSKNSMGGYTGSKRFISNGTADMTFSEEAMGSEFPGTWDLVCSGRILATSE